MALPFPLFSSSIKMTNVSGSQPESRTLNGPTSTYREVTQENASLDAAPDGQPNAQPDAKPNEQQGTKRANSSMVWDHFKKIGYPKNPRGECMYCSKTYSCISKNETNTMMNYLGKCKKNPFKTEEDNGKEGRRG